MFQINRFLFLGGGGGVKIEDLFGRKYCDVFKPADPSGVLRGVEKVKL